MKSYRLNWQGWWLLRTPISDVPELATKCCVYAVLGAKLKKVGGGVGSSAREPILFNVYKGDEPVKEHLLKMQRMSLGVFVANRAKEIAKHAIVYVAPMPEDTDLGELATILSLIYGAVPYAPKHHAMPPTYEGESVLVTNDGRNPALPQEILHGIRGDAAATQDPDSTRDGTADNAMAAAIAAEAQATRRLTQAEMDVRGIATEKVDKPDVHLATEKLDKPPRLVETTRIDKDDVGQGLATERVPKPPAVAANHDTEFVPKPADSEEGDAEDEEPAPEILDEAGR